MYSLWPADINIIHIIEHISVLVFNDHVHLWQIFFHYTNKRLKFVLLHWRKMHYSQFTCLKSDLASQKQSWNFWNNKLMTTCEWSAVMKLLKTRNHSDRELHFTDNKQSSNTSVTQQMVSNIYTGSI